MRQKVQQIVQAVDPQIPGYMQKTMEVLERFCSIDCGTRDVEGNGKVVEILDGLLSEIEGIQIEHRFFEGYGSNIIARLNPGCAGGKILLNGHMDTVFKRGDTKDHPFHVEGDRAYGLGIVDCKAGLLVAIFSVLAMQKAGMLPDKEILFVFGCDEEAGSPVSRNFYPEVAEGAQMAFVFEPSREEDGVLTSRKGSARYVVECHGKRAHAGNNYEDGASAVVELSHKLVQMYEKNDNHRKIQFNPAMITDGMDRVNIVPDSASANVGVRVRDQQELAYVEAVMKELAEETYIKGCTTEVTRKSYLAPMEPTEGNRNLYRHIAQVGELLGVELAEQTSGGYGDSCVFSSMGIPTVDALGPYMYKIHSFDESMRISSIGEKIRLFCAVLGTL